MKKYVILILMSIALLFVFVNGIGETKETIKYQNDITAEIKEKCLSKNGVYDTPEMEAYCYKTIKEDKYTIDLISYMSTYNNELESVIDDIYSEKDEDNEVITSYGPTVFAILLLILMCLMALDSVFFVKDYMNKQKKSNKMDNTKKCICISMIPTIPVLLYAIAKLVSPFIIINNILVVTGNDVLYIFNYCASLIATLFIVSIVGLIAYKCSDKLLKSIILIIVVLYAVKLSSALIMTLLESIVPDGITYTAIGIFDVISTYHTIVTIVLAVIIYVIYARLPMKKVSK